MTVIHLVAGEESGDRLGGALMRALAARRDIRFGGIGGSEMAASGLASPFPLDELSVMGFASIPRRLPRILRRIRETAAGVITARPDALVIIDSPDFTHRVARRVRAAAPGIPIIDYVSPQVWAWRPGRARSMRAYVDHVLAVLPFEPEVHRRLGGPPCSYVGHPVTERVGELRPGPADAARRQAGPPVVLVLPGSRAGVVRRMIGPFGAALALAGPRLGPMELVLPTVPHLVTALEEATAGWPQKPRIVVDPAGKLAAFRTARAALAASGTVTLELALAGVPTVAAYRVAAWEAALARRLIEAPPSVILANLVLGENAVPEFLQEACTPEALADALVDLVPDTPARQRQCAAFARLDAIMEIGSAAPSARAAEIVLAMIAAHS
jgi:lipid-A-disaccharide synthase